MATVYPDSVVVQGGLGGSFVNKIIALGPIGYWPCREFTGTEAFDYSGNDRDGVYVGSPSLIQPSPLPEGGTSVTLDGSNDKITVASSALNLTAGPLSIVALVKLGTGSSNAGIAGTGRTNGFQLNWHRPSGVVSNLTFFIGSDVNYAEATGISVTGWRLVVATWTGTTAANGIKVYVDGALAAQGTAATTVLSATGFQIGQNSTYFNGSMAHVAVFSSELSLANVQSLYAACEWTSFGGDVRLGEMPITVKYGMQSNGPFDHVAGIGTMSFAMNNAANNSAALLGYYSPGHANCRSGFDLGIPIRLAITSSGTTYYKFHGTLASVKVSPGSKRDRVVVCTAVDWLDVAGRWQLVGVPTQVSKRSDEVFLAIAANVPVQPPAYSVVAGTDTYAYALDNYAGGNQPFAMTEFQRLEQSELGFVYQKGDTVQGGTVVAESRDTRMLATVALTLTNQGTNLALSRSREQIKNRVRMIVNPRTVDAAATAVLFTLQNKPDIAPGQSITIEGNYVDPNQKAAKVGGTDMVTPVATTDFLMNTASDGSGTNVTANFTVTAEFNPGNVIYTITNNHATLAGFVTFLQARGRGIYAYEPVVCPATNDESVRAYGPSTLEFTMPYQSSPLVGKGAADWYLSIYGTPQTFANGIELPMNKSAAFLSAGLAREISDRVQITEAVAGISGLNGFINNVSLSIEKRHVMKVSWSMAPSPSNLYFWLLGVSGSSELGSTTRLAYL